MTGGNNYDEEIAELNRRISDLELELQKLRSEMSKAFSNVQDQLNTKAPLDAISDLENRLLEKMNELF